MARLPLVLGLTGSIGMGKSTAARFLQREGWRVFDADKAVHRLMAPGGQAVASLAKTFPAVLAETPSGQRYIDRSKLRQHIIANPGDLPALEAILHPLVRQAQRRARYLASKGRCHGLVLDIPLLFETGGDQRCDWVLVVTAPAMVQKSRVMARSGITEAAFNTLLAKQMPDQEKRRRANFIVQTGLGHRHARRQMTRAIKQMQASLRGRNNHQSRHQNRRRSTFHPPLFGPDNPRRWTPKRRFVQYGGQR